MSALDVVSSFNWKWWLKDLSVPDKPVKVFSTFSCGGGSSMGYKRAGFEVIGNVEIDKGMNAMYVKNLNPKYNFNMDLRDFNQLSELPEELYHLDILDGSPPCTTFSTEGKREKTWGVNKKFREGQKVQRLDDLFFVFLDTVKKLQPKIVIAENVIGLLGGKAKGYVHEIIQGFQSANYSVQIFKLNAASMEVPQVRNRVFFVANNQGYPKLELTFNYPPIYFGKVRSKHGLEGNNSLYDRLVMEAKESDKDFSKLTKSGSGFTDFIVADNDICPCNTTKIKYRLFDRKRFSIEDYINTQTFPQDYDFCGNKAEYVTGMSVPPNMMAHIAKEIWRQWLNGKK